MVGSTGRARRAVFLLALGCAVLAATPESRAQDSEPLSPEVFAERLEPARRAASKACATPLAVAIDPTNRTIEPGSVFSLLSACRAAFAALEESCGDPRLKEQVAGKVGALLCNRSGPDQGAFISLSEGILRYGPGGEGDAKSFVSGFLKDAL